MESRTTLADRVVVITGASSGFGRGVALKLAEEGGALVLAARRGEVLDDVARRCASAGARARAVPTDVSNRADVEALARAAVSEFGRVDVWINDAGVGAVGQFHEVPLDDHEQVIRTDLLGTLYGTYCAYREFVRQGSGTLINVASELGKYTVPYYASYAAAKHGVVGLSEALQQEIAQIGVGDVHVCLVMPTAHDTPFFDHAANYSGHPVEPPTPLHDPGNVVDTIVRLVHDPEDKTVVGADGVVKIVLKAIAAPIQEKVAAWQMHRTQMDQDAGAPDSPGAVHSPTPEGTGVSGGRRARR
jgi:short-subunit dehydrogenase